MCLECVAAFEKEQADARSTYTAAKVMLEVRKLKAGESAAAAAAVANANARSAAERVHAPKRARRERGGQTGCLEVPLEFKTTVRELRIRILGEFRHHPKDQVGCRCDCAPGLPTVYPPGVGRDQVAVTAGLSRIQACMPVMKLCAEDRIADKAFLCSPSLTHCSVRGLTNRRSTC